MDESLRRLAREQGDDAKEKYYRERKRAGELSEQQITVASLLGDVTASKLIEMSVPNDAMDEESMLEWVNTLQDNGNLELVRRMQSAYIRFLLGKEEVSEAFRSKVEEILEQFESRIVHEDWNYTKVKKEFDQSIEELNQILRSVEPTPSVLMVNAVVTDTIKSQAHLDTYEKSLNLSLGLVHSFESGIREQDSKDYLKELLATLRSELLPWVLGEGDVLQDRLNKD